MNKLIRRILIYSLLITFSLGLSGCDLIRETQTIPTAEETQRSQAPQTATTAPADRPTLPPAALTPTIIHSPTIETPTATEIRSAISTNPILHGMNLGNALEAPEPGQWGVTIQESYITDIAEAGFNAVRIPARFSAHTATPTEYSIDPDFLETVDQVLRWGLDADLIVILDFHGFDEIMQNPSEFEAQFLKIWEQLAVHYQTYPQSLWFELLNEPSRNLKAQTWNRYVRSAVSLIRQSNPTRKILIGGVDYSTVDSLYLLNLPADANLIGVFHFYHPFEFTHQGAAWVPGSSDWLGTTWVGSETQKTEVQSALDRAMLWSHQAQTPVLMGEFGAIKEADSESRQRWISFVSREAEDRDIGWLYWGFCADLGVYNCAEEEWYQALLNTLIQP